MKIHVYMYFNFVLFGLFLICFLFRVKPHFKHHFSFIGGGSGFARRKTPALEQVTDKTYHVRCESNESYLYGENFSRELTPCRLQ